MPRRPWHLSRRTFLRGGGAALALPLLDAMRFGRAADAAPRPRRLCCVFFANGVGLPPAAHPAHADWNWFPHADGPDYKFTKTLEPLAPFRDDLTVVGGLSHPTGRGIVGHATADIWLTGGDVRGTTYNNGISVDQRAGQVFGADTRYPSLTLSTNGGVGYKGRAASVSFDRRGEAVPAESLPRAVFDRLFGAPEGGTLAAQKATLRRDRLLVDGVLDDARTLRGRLGSTDQRKLDEYLESVQEVERRVGRADAWLGAPRPAVDPKAVDREATPAGPRDYLRAMFDLVLLSFQTDVTRSVAFQISQEDGAGVSDKFPGLVLKGHTGSHHGLSHGTAKPTGYEDWGRYDRFLAEQLAYFLGRLKAAGERDGTLLDHSLVLYGSATSTTHLARNYPLVVAGGGKLGVKHGRYRRYTEATPMSNLLLSLLHGLGVRDRAFADSTGTLDWVAG